ncbi:MAG: response regulator [Rhodoferax sp.]
MIKQKISVLIAEDHALLRVGIRILLDKEPDIQVIGEACTGEEAIVLAKEKSPDVILMDLNMPGRGGLYALAEIKKSAPSIKVLVVTMHKTGEYIRQALHNGASGYILKETAHAEIVFAIRRILEGKTYVSPDVSDAMIAGIVSSARNDVPSPQAPIALTSRELAVLKLVVAGYVNKQVADQMKLSIKTIEKHRSSLMRKLNLRNTAMLVTYAMNNGLLDL